MADFIKACAAVGIFTLYAFVTGIPGLIGYRFLKHTTIDKPVDKEAIWKGLLVSYIIGLIAFVWVVVFFVIVRG